MNTPSPIEPWEELYAYWRAKHVGGRPPSRSEIDPMIDLPHLAPSLVVIDLRPEGFEYRLIGSEVVNRFGVDRTGKKVGASSVDEVQTVAWRGAVEGAARDKKPHLLASHYPGAQTPWTIALVLPLSPDADGMVKLLGANYFERPRPRSEAYPEIDFRDITLDV